MKLFNWTSGVGEKNPTPTPSVLRNPTPTPPKTSGLGNPVFLGLFKQLTFTICSSFTDV